MAYAQWVTIIVTNIGTVTIKVENLSIAWGKLFSGSKDNEVSTSSVNDHAIPPESTYIIQACGRESESSGTEGSFDLISQTDNSTVAHIYWDCPWGSKSNTFTVNASNSKWLVENSGANLDSGAIGNVTVTCLNRP